MNKNECNLIINKVKSLYPNIKLNETILAIWIKELQRADYELTDKKLEAYYRDNRYAPHLKDFIAIKEFNYAQLQYQEIQRDIEYNKKHSDPVKRQKVRAMFNQLKESLEND